MATSKHYVFVVETNVYAGNFSRHLCAHITGHIGECEVGKHQVNSVEDIREDYPDLADVFSSMKWIDENIYQQDQRGCFRPCAIWETPGRSNNGNGVHYTVTKTSPYKWPAYESVGIFFYKEPPLSVLKFMMERAKTFQCFSESVQPEIIRFRLEEVRETVTYTDIWSS